MLQRAIAADKPGAVLAVFQNAGAHAQRKEKAGDGLRLRLPGEKGGFLQGRHEIIHRRQQGPQQFQSVFIRGDKIKAGGAPARFGRLQQPRALSLVHCRQQSGPAVMQEATVKDGVKFRLTDEQGVRRAPAVQGRTFAVGANRQDRRRGLLQRGALDKRAVDAQPGIAGEDKVGFFIFAQAGHRCGADPELRGVNIGPRGGAGGVEANLLNKGDAAARRDRHHRAPGDIQNSQADKHGVKGCHRSPV